MYSTMPVTAITTTTAKMRAVVLVIAFIDIIPLFKIFFYPLIFYIFTIPLRIVNRLNPQTYVYVFM
jgi:hypothetical protein